MNIVPLIIEVVSGAVGGNVSGAAMKENSLGAVGNSIAGIVGGGLGGTILQIGDGSCGLRRREHGISARFLVMWPAVVWVAQS